MFRQQEGVADKGRQWSDLDTIKTSSGRRLDVSDCNADLALFLADRGISSSSSSSVTCLFMLSKSSKSSSDSTTSSVGAILRMLVRGRILCLFHHTVSNLATMSVIGKLVRNQLFCLASVCLPFPYICRLVLVSDVVFSSAKNMFLLIWNGLKKNLWNNHIHSSLTVTTGRFSVDIGRVEFCANVIQSHNNWSVI